MSYQLLWSVSIIVGVGEHHTREEGLDVPVTNLKGLVTRSSSDILNIVVMLHFDGKGCRAQWRMVDVELSWVE